MDFLRFVFRSGKGGFALGVLTTLALIFGWNYLDMRSTMFRRVSETKAAALSQFDEQSVAWSPGGMWRKPRLMNVMLGIHGLHADFGPAPYYTPDEYSNHSKKILRRAQLELRAKSPLDAMNRIRDLSDAARGVVVSAVSQGANEPYARADITLQVPSESLEATLREIRKLATEIAAEQVETLDVTKQYVDQEAAIRNLEAQEQQYLRILKTANKVEDVMSVTEKLDGVRGEIDKSKAEFKTLQHDIAMSSIKVTITRDSATARFYNWRPVQEVRASAANAVEGTVTVFNSVVAVLFYIPVLVLWMLVFFGFTIVMIRILRRLWRRVRPLYGWGGNA
jgi:hypothetical protein